MSRWMAAFGTLILLCATSQAFDPKHLIFKDPSGDDKGPGKYSYPTDAAYKAGSFDLLELSIHDKGADLEFCARLATKIDDPWNSKSWGGNGFSLQMIQVYVDTKKGGFLATLPGINVKFAKGEGWDKVVFLSPQPRAKILAEVKTKATKMLGAVVVPRRTSVAGKEIVALVAKSDLGTPDKSWGFQAVVQSNEGYAETDSVLARKVNEYPGQHRFGGGNDHDCDPHAIDILASPAKGGDDEKQTQFKELAGFTCTASGDGQKATIHMVYPGR